MCWEQTEQIDGFKVIARRPTDCEAVSGNERD
jgi:hypothetical protein